MHVLYHRLSLCCFLLTLGLLVCGAQAKIPPLMVEVLQFNKTPMVPLTPLADISGASVAVNGTAYTVTRGQHTFAFTLQSTAAQQDAQPVTLPLAPFFTGGVAYVPLEPLATALGGSIALHGPEKTVEITLPECAPFTFMLYTPEVTPAEYQNTNMELYLMNTDGSGLYRLSYTGHEDHLPVFSPDGTKCLYNYKDKLYIRGLDQQQAQVLTTGLLNPEWFGQPVFSADGRQIACVASEKTDSNYLCVMNVDGSDKRLLGNGNHPCFSPDGKKIAFVDYVIDGDYVFTMNSDGTNRRQLFAGFAPYFSPDGTVIVAMKRLPKSVAQAQVVATYPLTGPRAGKVIMPKTPDWVIPYEHFGGFSADGKMMLVSKGSLEEGGMYWGRNYAVSFDQSVARLLEPEVMSDSTPRNTTDGRIIYLAEKALIMLDVKTERLTTLTKQMNISDFTLTPDGKQIIFVVQQQ